MPRVTYLFSDTVLRLFYFLRDLFSGMPVFVETPLRVFCSYWGRGDLLQGARQGRINALWILRREEAAWIRRGVDVPMQVSFVWK